MIFLGCDPDLHNTSFAVVDEKSALQYFKVVKIPKGITGRDAILHIIGEIGEFWIGCREGEFTGAAVEAQELYQSGPYKTPNPKSIMYLATVAGAALSYLSDRMPPFVYPCFPTPAEWKGQIPKLVHHKRIAAKAGIPQQYWKEMGGKDPYLSITDPQYVSQVPNASDWKHVMDAIGLAQYAAEQYTTYQKKLSALNTSRSAAETSPRSPNTQEMSHVNDAEPSLADPI